MISCLQIATYVATFEYEWNVDIIKAQELKSVLKSESGNPLKTVIFCDFY